MGFTKEEGFGKEKNEQAVAFTYNNGGVLILKSYLLFKSHTMVDWIVYKRYTKILLMA